MSSGQYSQKKKQPRGGNSSNYPPLRQRPPKNQERSVLSEGIYKNELFVFNAISVIGSAVRILVNNGKIYEGIFRTFSVDLDIVVDNVHLVEGSKLPCKESIIPHMAFHWRDVASMSLTDVNMDYAILGGDGFVDASISGRHNGRVGERELQPWINTDDCSELESGSLEDSNSNGWPANCMFEANESKFNYKSKYDPSLKDYTTELHRTDTDEYRSREAEAERHASEIQSSSTFTDNTDLENGDEEMRYSAVHRPEDAAPPAVAPTGNGGGKYVVPQNRNAVQSGVTSAQRPQQLVVLPSTQTDAVHGQHVPAVPQAAVETGAGGSSSSPGVLRINAGEARKEEMERLPPASVPKVPIAAATTFEPTLDKTKMPGISVSGALKPEAQKPRAEAIQELMEFRENFKLPDAAADPKELKHQGVQQPLLPASQPAALAPVVPLPVAIPLSQVPPMHQQVASHQTPIEPNHRGGGFEEKGDARDDLKDDISKKSSLNPTAKEFVPAVKVYGTPKNLPSQTPPRPPSTVGSPVFMPYMQSSTPLYHTAIMPPPANLQQQRNAGVANKRASVSVSARPDVNPPPQAMTGAPLITQQMMIPGQVVPGSLQMMPVHQPVLRMIHQHPQNMMIDPNQHMFAVPMASSLTSHQPPHSGAGMGQATHHMIAGGGLSSAMHGPHGAGGIAVAPPQQTSGAPTPTAVQQYGQPPQPGSTMSLPTTSGTPQPPAQIQFFPGGPGGTLTMSHPQQMHPVSLQHINNPTSPIIYQTPSGMMQFPQFPHQAPGLAYATAGGQQPGQSQVVGGQQQMGAPHQQPPPSLGPSSHVVMHGPQMVMGPHQGQGAYMGMPVPMTQAGLAQHPVAFHMYSMPGAGGHTFAFNP